MGMGKSKYKVERPVQLQGIKKLSDEIGPTYKHRDNKTGKVEENNKAVTDQLKEPNSLPSTSRDKISPDLPSKGSSGSENDAFIHSTDIIPASDSSPAEHVSTHHVCPLDESVSDRSTGSSHSPSQPLVRESKIRQRVVTGKECARDVESGFCPTCVIESADQAETSADLSQIESFTSKKWGNKKGTRKIRGFYKKQDKLIDMYENAIKSPDEIAADNTIKQASLIAKIVLVLNLGLLIGKVVAAILSGSMSIIAALVDSAVDLVSGIVIWWSNRAMRKKKPLHYPQGRARLEPIAIIVLAVVMAVSSLFVMKEAIQLIVHYAQTAGGGNTMGIATIVICCVTIVTKIGLFIACYRIKNPSTLALSQDQRNDVLSNAVALACGFIGARVWKFADPIGAVVICLYIIIGWIITGKEQIRLLSGHVAEPDIIKKVTFVAMNFSPKIVALETVRVYHVGINYLVEVHIILPASMTVQEGHDIGEGLTKKIEQFPEFERAFIHVDYDADHTPSKEHKIL